MPLVSTSLSVECDPVDQPAATDPVERRTWSALRIRVGGRTVSRIWDRALQQERSLLYVPAFPIAEWIVFNWWTLLNEPCRTEELPRPSARSYHLSWIKRHCLRSAESGLLLPALYLFNDGQNLRAVWQADDRDTLPNMPGEFIDSGADSLGVAATEDVLARFVAEILGRVEAVDDERVAQVHELWRAIRSADAEEANFCIIAGRMGLDPYDRSAMPEELARFIETALSDPELPVARDQTEVAEMGSVEAQWQWVRQTATALRLGPLSAPPIPGRVGGRSPAQQGYELAAEVRARAGLDPSGPLPSVEALAQAVASVPFRIEDRNHIPGHGLRAVVGWTGADSIAVAGPRLPRADNERFLLARGLYHALFGCDRSERLVTDAYTWDQQASRAFAAELLAPQSALAARTRGRADRAAIDKLAEEFKASTMLIEKQLGNAGVMVIDE
jgi:hypothetical protein